MHRNTVVYVELKVVHVKEAYDRWLEDEGVLLADKISEKKRLSKDYQTKVLYFLVTQCVASLYIFFSKYISSLTYLG